MDTNVIGRVNNLNLPKSKSLLPIFEAIINAFDAIDDAQKGNKGKIEIIIEREGDQQTLHKEDRTLHSIKNITVKDNGIGFDKTNFKSFQQSDSFHKHKRGGKGIGRFLWLKLFSSVKIYSCFQVQGEYFRRTFNFDLTEEGVNNVQTEEAQHPSDGTTIQLLNIKDEYKEHLPKDIQTISHRIIEHCLTYFLNTASPTVTLQDLDNEINLNSVFNDVYKETSNSRKFKIANEDFDLLNLKLYSSLNKKNRIIFCANNREVIIDNLAKYASIFGTNLADDEGKHFVHVSYISSTYLDKIVNAERTNFSFDKETEFLKTTPDLITQNMITDEVIKIINDDLKEILNPIVEKKNASIKEYIQKESPQYRHLLKHDEGVFDDIAPDIKGEKLEVELFKKSHQVELQVKKEGEQLKKQAANITDLNEYKEKYDKYLEDLNEIGKSNLAKYIIHRKSVLELFENGLNKRDDDKYELESAIVKSRFLPA